MPILTVIGSDLVW